MKKNNALLTLLTSLLFIPVAAYAQTNLTTSFGTIGGYITSFRDSIVKSLVTLFATMAMAAFFFGVVQYIWGFREGKEDKITAGKKFMVWSVIALFVMFSIWGIIIFFQNTLGIGGSNTIIIPDIQVGPSTGSSNPLGATCSSITDMSTCSSTAGCIWNISSGACQ